MPTPDVNVSAILRALAYHDVKYVVIGGFAAELHDVAITPTRDIDITPSVEGDNLSRLAAALRDLDARLRMPEDPDGLVVPGGITAELIENVSVLTLITAAGPLDVAVTPDGTTGYDDLASTSVEISHGEQSIHVAALEDVIRSKEAAGREKDLLVLPALRAHLRATQRHGPVS